MSYARSIESLPTSTTPQEMGNMIRTELARWKKVVREADIGAK